MDSIVVFSLLAVVVAAGFGALLLRARRDLRRDRESERSRQAAESTIESVQQQLTQQLAQQLGYLVESLQDKVDAGDRVVLERLAGLTTAVDAKVGVMSTNLAQQVDAMGSELGQLRTLVAQLQNDRARQHGELKSSLEAAIDGQRVLNETAGQLREALANPQARGQWGERMAEDVLRAAGMVENFSYRKQTALEGGTKPDFTFLLPHDRVLHMDVKFPAANYLKFLAAESDSEAAQLKALFLRDVRGRVKELGGRGYASEESTVGCLLLFIPNETVFGFINEHDTALLDDAMAQSVVLCSPSTLFAVLRVIRQAMDTYALEQATDEILECLASFGKQWQAFSGQVDKVDKHLGTLNNSFGELSGTRRRQLERQLDKIDDIRSRVGAAQDGPVLSTPSAPPLREVEAG